MYKNIRLPASKSLAIRSLLLASFSKGESFLEGELSGKDVEIACRMAQDLGANLQVDPQGLIVKPQSFEAKNHFYLGESGILARCLPPLLAHKKGTFTFYGEKTLLQRPMENLVEYLSSSVQWINSSWPLVMKSQGEISTQNWPKDFSKTQNISSQFFSGFLLGSPFLKGPAYKTFIPQNLVSSSYVLMTLALMGKFGIQIHQNNQNIEIPVSQSYKACHITLETDMSTASYFLAAGLLGLGAQLHNLPEPSSALQRDSDILNILKEAGAPITQKSSMTIVNPSPLYVLNGFNLNLSTLSDLAPTLAVLALFAKSPSQFSGLEHTQYKESSRAKIITEQFQRLGAKASYTQRDGLMVCPLPLKEFPKSNFQLKTYGDHRLAMAFSLISGLIPNISIDDPLCVEKTCPNFFNLLKGILPIHQSTTLKGANP